MGWATAESQVLLILARLKWKGGERERGRGGVDENNTKGKNSINIRGPMLFNTTPTAKKNTMDCLVKKFTGLDK